MVDIVFDQHPSFNCDLNMLEYVCIVKFVSQLHFLEMRIVGQHNDVVCLFQTDGDQDLMLCTAVLSRIEDSVHDIRLKALGIAKAVATAFVDRLPVQSVIYKACSQMHLNDDPSRDFQVSFGPGLGYMIIF